MLALPIVVVVLMPPREGGPPTRQMNQMNAHNSYQQNPHVENPQGSFVEQNVLWKQRPSSDIARS